MGLTSPPAAPHRSGDPGLGSPCRGQSTPVSTFGAAVSWARGPHGGQPWRPGLLLKCSEGAKLHPGERVAQQEFLPLPQLVCDLLPAARALVGCGSPPTGGRHSPLPAAPSSGLLGRVSVIPGTATRRGGSVCQPQGAGHPRWAPALDAVPPRRAAHLAQEHPELLLLPEQLHLLTDARLAAARCSGARL